MEPYKENNLKPIEIVIMGFSQVGKMLFDYERERGGDSTIVFCDNSSVKQGLTYKGALVLSPEKAAKESPDALFIVASLYHKEQMARQLQEIGVAKICLELPSEVKEKALEVERNRRIKPRKSLHLEININKHCNLCCKGCDHFAPLSGPDFMDFDQYKRDMERLSELFHGKADEILLLGGEPLLNPDIISYMKTARRCFPDGDILVCTNGLLLDRMIDEFWSACKELSIVIAPTRYPVKFDYDKAERMSKERGVRYRYLGSSESGRELWHFPFDIEGTQDARESFINCRNANSCLTLENGRLYTCSIAPNIYLFNNYYGRNLRLGEDDGIDIYKASSANEILEAMARPMPFCRYCNVKGRTYDHPWEQSKKKIEEWT